MKLTKATRAADIKRSWYLVDVKDKILGRIASQIAQLLMGKSKSYFVPYLDCGDYVVLVNAASVQVTGKKAEQKLYMQYSGFPAGLKKKNFKQVLQENPERIIKKAVSGMLPNNKLKDSMLRRLYIFVDEKHPYEEKIKNQKAKI